MIMNGKRSNSMSILSTALALFQQGKSGRFTTTTSTTTTIFRAYSSVLSSSDSIMKRRLGGVIFDMDGTIVKSTLDFDEMYRRVGVPRTADILSVIASFDEPRRLKAIAAIEEVERDALHTMVLLPGAVKVGLWAQTKKIPLGLVTRNTASSVAFLHDRLWISAAGLSPFLPAVARDDGLPHKPDPAALLKCASHWGVEPTSCIMVGDSPRDDITAGRRAGMTTVFVSAPHGRHGAAAGTLELKGEQEPHHRIACLSELPDLIEKLFEVP